MSIGARSGSPPAQREETRQSGFGLALVVIAGAQFMLTLDSTIMNIALPSIQTDLDVAAANLAWIVTAYALSFGGLLLLGGRAGDVFGRRLVFQIGLVVFTAASLLGGLAFDELTLILARLLQGVGAALAAPTAMALLVTTFPEGPARAKAMGIFAAMPPVGSTAGLLLGGVLTEFADWRWVLIVNVPIGIALLWGTKVFAKGDRGQGKLDIPGAATATIGVTTLVYSITRGETHGWTDWLTLTGFAVSFVLLAAFLAIQSRSAHPMMPLRVLKDRDRAGANATMLFVGTGMFSTYFFLTLYMQQVLDMSALEAGLAYLPFALSIALSAGLISPKMLAKLSPREVTGTGLILAIIGMIALSRLTPDSSYALHLMPSMIVIGLGLGLCFVPMTMGAVRGVDREDTGIASGIFSAGTQVGGALGLAALSTVAAGVTADRLPAQGSALDAAMTTGYTTAFFLGALLYGVAFVIVVTTIRIKRP